MATAGNAQKSTAFKAIKQLQERLNQRIIGQQALMSRLLIALLADGHLLVEGAPGLAKTTAIKALAAGIQADFQRIQFTPDLLPADLTGTDIFRPQDGSFHFQPGPLLHSVILADEINRSPAKVQSALLEAMGERQITIGQETYSLPKLFLVMATQNPIEQEGTYPLPEAQLDRFLMYVKIDYPDAGSEQHILQLNRQLATQSSDMLDTKIEPIAQELIFQARDESLKLHMSSAIEEYLVQLVVATRSPERYGQDLKQWVRFGASPRATIGLDRAARAHAWLQGHDFVSPDDIQAIAHDILRHRIILTFEAEAEGLDTDHFITELLKRVSVP